MLTLTEEQAHATLRHALLTAAARATLRPPFAADLPDGTALVASLVDDDGSVWVVATRDGRTLAEGSPSEVRTALLRAAFDLVAAIVGSRR